MLTLPAATRLLSQSLDVAGLLTVARACGFTGAASELDAAARRSLGLSGLRTARVVEGPRTLRALCAEIHSGVLTREFAAQIAGHLQKRSPFALWLVFLTDRGGSHAAISAAVIAPRRRASVLLVDRTHIVDSDAEAVRALAATADGPDLLVHARWCELLGREAVTQRFFRALERTVVNLGKSLERDVPPGDARTLAILTSTRLLFLSFLEAKGWLDGDHGFLRRTWDACMSASGAYHRRILLPLCFGTLNTPRGQRAAAARAFGRIPFLNGGLFTRTPLEQQHRRALFPDESLGELVGDLLGRWRFTVKEHEATQAEAAVDPEMLGLAFESLMASHERRSSGSFYTPRILVERVFDGALSAALERTPVHAAYRSLQDTSAADADARDQLRQQLAGLRILDPACGSGAFLVHALDSLAGLRTACGDLSEPGALRRDILARQIFGVDREPIAVWLCELRLWLSVVVESGESDPCAVPPLPNLDANVRVGDALAGDAFVSRADRGTGHQLGKLRVRYARATGARKRTLARTLAVAERRAATEAIDARLASVAARRRDLLSAVRGRDLFGARITTNTAARAHLTQLRRDARDLRAARKSLSRGGAVAFDFAAQFADIGARGGFDLVIGNPPWVRLHRIPAEERARLRSQFQSYRHAGWRAGALLAGAATGFAAQVDLAALFVERAVSLTRTGGTVSLLVPAKLWRSLAGGGVRHLLMESTRIVELEDWSEARATFDAAVYPSLVIAAKEIEAPAGDIRIAEHHRDRVLSWTCAPSSLAIDASPGAPWLWLPAAPRDGFDLVRSLGTPLGEREGFRPRLGVKCGLNEAFVVERLADGSVRASDGRTAAIEPALVRPLLRGEHVTPWRVAPRSDGIVFPYDRCLNLLKPLPALTRAWLAPKRTQLCARTDLGGRPNWWSLFRIDAADSRKARVVWADLTRSPRVAVLPPGDLTVPLNTCYTVFAEDVDEACALTAWLNSPLTAAWLAALAEPARGGFRRMFGWTMSLMPIPRDWDNAAPALSRIGARALAGDSVGSDELLDACLLALGTTRHAVSALLTWGHR